MKILLVSNMYPSTEFPSYGVFVKNTEEILENEGFTIEKAVLTKKKSKLTKALGYIKHYTAIVSKGLFNKYDAIYVHYAAHNALPLLVLKKLKPSVRIVTNVHGSDVVPEVASQEKFQPNVKKLLQRSSLIITPSHYYEGLVQTKYGVDSPIRIFPSGGVNADVFYPAKNSRAEHLEYFQLSDEFHYLGYVGRMDVGKGWDHLLKGFSLYLENNPEKKGDVRLIMVGSGKDDDAFFKMRKDLGLDDCVIHFPLMRHSELAMIYNIIDLFIFPTTRKGESLGLVGLEAMACGTPILASDIGGILDYVIHEQNSWLFKTGDPSSLAQGLENYFLIPEDEKNRIEKAASETAAQYEQKKIQSILSNIFMEIT